MVCIETNRILDSCRDRDCYENVRVYLSDLGHEIIERTSSIRAKEAKIVWTLEATVKKCSLWQQKRVFVVHIHFFLYLCS